MRGDNRSRRCHSGAAGPSVPAACYLFATAIGFVQFAPRSTNDELSKAFVDRMSQGLSSPTSRAA